MHPPSHPSYNGPPQVPPPWIAEWDPPANRWLFVNRENGQRTFDYPHAYGGQYRGAPYEEQINETIQYNQPPPPPQGGYYQQAPPPQKSHAGRNTALAAVGGLAAGALLMHEGEKVGKSILFPDANND